MLKTNYLIIGTGAVGMAFADVLVSETKADIIMVDRFQKPGGHWNFAYPFVTLHQPSAFYGVSSTELNKNRKDVVGLNKGLNDLASGAEILAYYDEVMRHRFLPSGRVRYFPLCNYEGGGKFTSTLTGESYQVEFDKIVDGSYLKTEIPSTHTPNFNIAPEVNFMSLNDLPGISTPPRGFVVIGGGKTGIDACLWLLEHKVDPDKITWIVSRDAWLLDRRNTQPTIEFFNYSIGAQADQLEAVANATSIEDLFNRLEDKGVLVRIDKTVRPSMFHGATISIRELEELRRIKNVVRLGRVRGITSDSIELAEGSIPTSTGHVHIDCSASAISNLAIKPIFEGNLITPQSVRSYQPVFSAAFVAHIEATYDSEAKKNEVCTVVPIPNHDTDWIKMIAIFMVNQYNWNQEKGLKEWLINNRLDGFSALMKQVSKDDHEKQAIIQRLRDNALPAVAKLQEFMAELS
ncbi:MAG: hypothetical protein OTI34_08500 [Lewinella sp.]|nr:hypothetical protein [Lewinella sp.]